MPILTITGSYDDDQPVRWNITVTSRNASTRKCERHFLIIGPGIMGNPMAASVAA